MVVCTVSPNTRDEYDDIVYCLCLAFLQAILVPPAAIANEGNEETDFENRKKKTYLLGWLGFCVRLYFFYDYLDVSIASGRSERLGNSKLNAK